MPTQDQRLQNAFIVRFGVARNAETFGGSWFHERGRDRAGRAKSLRRTAGRGLPALSGVHPTRWSSPATAWRPAIALRSETTSSTPSEPHRPRC